MVEKPKPKDVGVEYGGYVRGKRVGYNEGLADSEAYHTQDKRELLRRISKDLRDRHGNFFRMSVLRVINKELSKLEGEE